MRLQLSKLAVIISFHVYTIAATNRPRNYVCERKYFSADSVSKSLENACNALKCADVSCRYTAAFDGSEFFGIRDAVLFSVPTKVCYDHQYKGGNLLRLSWPEDRVDTRIVIDSMCNLIGLVYRSKGSYHRCEETIDSYHGSTIISDNESNISPKKFGYRCNGKLFMYQDILNSYENTKEKLSHSAEAKNKISITKVYSPQFDDKKVYLWSIKYAGDVRKIDHRKAGPYRIATNKVKDMIGMMYRNNLTWYRCIEMQSIDPKPPTAGDGTKNSIGETIFDNISPHRCGQKIFSVITLNSHMQAACRAIKEDANMAVGGEFSFPMPNPAANDGDRNTWLWPLRLPEYEGLKIVYEKHFYYIKLDLDCKFLGAYKRFNDKFIPCRNIKESQPSLE